MTVAGRARGNRPLALHPSARLRDIFATIIAFHDRSSLYQNLLKIFPTRPSLHVLYPSCVPGLSRLKCIEGARSALALDYSDAVQSFAA